MKKILTIIALATVASLAHTQGLLIFENASSAFDNYTNLTLSTTEGGPGATGGGLTFASSQAPNAYFYTLLIAATTGAAPSDNPLDPTWSQAMLYTNSSVALMANNYLVPGSMAGPNGVGGTAINGFAGGSSAYIMLVGWSANLGTSWSTVDGELQDSWSVPGADPTQNHFFGYTPVGEITLSSGGIFLPASIFGGTGLPGGVTMDFVIVPEPTTLALAGLGGISLLILRRRKS